MIDLTLLRLTSNSVAKCHNTWMTCNNVFKFSSSLHMNLLLNVVSRNCSCMLTYMTYFPCNCFSVPNIIYIAIACIPLSLYILFHFFSSHVFQYFHTLICGKIKEDNCTHQTHCAFAKIAYKVGYYPLNALGIATHT